METVTFSHFSDVSWMGVLFVMSLTTMRGEENMAAVFVSLRLAVLGMRVLCFFLVGRTSTDTVQCVLS